MALPEHRLCLAILQVWNDYVSEFTAPHRIAPNPLASLPFWDVDASIAEMQRASRLGHRGVVWAATLARHGLPDFTDPAWVRFYTAALDLEISINFHIGVGNTEADIATFRDQGDPSDAANRAGQLANTFLSNASTISKIITTGLCERFRRLKFVSVEAGFGCVPFLLEALAWHISIPTAVCGSRTGCSPASTFVARSTQCSGSNGPRWLCSRITPTTSCSRRTSPQHGSHARDRSIAESPRKVATDSLTGLSESTRRKVLFDNTAPAPFLTSRSPIDGTLLPYDQGGTMHATFVMERGFVELEPLSERDIQTSIVLEIKE